MNYNELENAMREKLNNETSGLETDPTALSKIFNKSEEKQGRRWGVTKDSRWVFGGALAAMMLVVAGGVLILNQSKNETSTTDTSTTKTTLLASSGVSFVDLSSRVTDLKSDSDNILVQCLSNNGEVDFVEFLESYPKSEREWSLSFSDTGIGPLDYNEAEMYGMSGAAFGEPPKIFLSEKDQQSIVECEDEFEVISGLPEIENRITNLHNDAHSDWVSLQDDVLVDLAKTTQIACLVQKYPAIDSEDLLEAGFGDGNVPGTDIVIGGVVTDGDSPAVADNTTIIIYPPKQNYVHGEGELEFAKSFVDCGESTGYFTEAEDIANSAREEIESKYQKELQKFYDELGVIEDSLQNNFDAVKLKSSDDSPGEFTGYFTEADLMIEMVYGEQCLALVDPGTCSDELERDTYAVDAFLRNSAIVKEFKYYSPEQRYQRTLCELSEDCSYPEAASPVPASALEHAFFIVLKEELTESEIDNFMEEASSLAAVETVKYPGPGVGSETE